MEELRPCYANFDFDISLLKSEFSKDINPNSKYNKSLQYLFFWTAKENELLYSADDSLYKNYQDRVIAFQGFIPKWTKLKANLHYWWGDCSTPEKWRQEKEINSKLTSHKIENELGISIESTMAYSKSDLPDDVKNYILKKEHGFSGQGFIKDINIIKYPILVEKKLERFMDYGTIIDKNSCKTFRNIIDQYGQYIGTYLNNSESEYISFKEVFDRIFIKYKEKYNVKKIQIDSFSYLLNDAKVLRPLCEVNHRKSMGWVTSCLNDKFGSTYSLFVIIPKHRFKTLRENTFSYNKEKKEGTIKLSTDSELIQSFFVTSESEKRFKDLISCICQNLKDSKNLSYFISSI